MTMVETETSFAYLKSVLKIQPQPFVQLPQSKRFVTFDVLNRYIKQFDFKSSSSKYAICPGQQNVKLFMVNLTSNF